MTSFHIDPTREGFSQFAKRTMVGPLHMLNLIRLRDRAIYEDGRDVSGAAAYKTYGRESAPFFKKAGGELIWQGVPHGVLIGPEDESWHWGFIAGYPSKEAFLTFVQDEGYQAIVHHRQAAVETSRLIGFAPDTTQTVFG